jgi:hypothetical protein
MVDKARESLFFPLKKYKKKSLLHEKNECSLAKQMRKLIWITCFELKINKIFANWITCFE